MATLPLSNSRAIKLSYPAVAAAIAALRNGVSRYTVNAASGQTSAQMAHPVQPSFTNITG
jgi:hypothetical protein